MGLVWSMCGIGILRSRTGFVMLCALNYCFASFLSAYRWIYRRSLSARLSNGALHCYNQTESTQMGPSRIRGQLGRRSCFRVFLPSCRDHEEGCDTTTGPGGIYLTVT
ncbi:hypothetical protein OE88DRAFT_240166 [Heliocybe sulcata]|uniref:Uncharacterized protein n=1 Tax=Heliocybe sulcata TaxID=5364 RepID=A0A5C3MZI6_9AGAM|nr:hypothetical protein OE88DRAFT_240166 [Heliocybe sulcata]